MGYLTKFMAATPENPRFSLNDPGAWEAFFAGAPSSANIPVNRQSALTLPAFWRGITLIANGVGKVHLPVYRRLRAAQSPVPIPAGARALAPPAPFAGRTLYPEHPAYRLLAWDPQPAETAFAFKRVMMQHALVRGNGYSFIDRAGSGRPLGLYHLDPDSTYPVRENGRVWYVVRVGGEERKLAYEDVLHFAGPGWDGLCGYDVLTYAREAVGEAIAKQRYSASFFGNNARAGVVIEVPAKMKKEAKQELVQGWERMHKGLENAHKTAILDGGAKINPLTVSAEQAQLIESRKFSIVDMANILGVPPHKLGSDGTTAYASLEQEDEAYLGDGLDPWLVMIEHECRKKLLTEEEKDGDEVIIEFDRRGLIRMSTVDRSAYFRTALAGQPWMTADEVREQEGMNPLGGKAAEYQSPLNMGTGGGMNNDNKDPGGPQPGNPNKAIAAQAGNVSDVLAETRECADIEAAIELALAEAVHDAAWRVVRRIAIQARRLKDSAAFASWLAAMPGDNQAVVQEILSPPVKAALALTRRTDRKSADVAAAFLASIGAELGTLGFDKIGDWTPKTNAPKGLVENLFGRLPWTVNATNAVSSPS